MSDNALHQMVYDVAAKIDGEWGCCHEAEAIEAGQCGDMTEWVEERIALIDGELKKARAVGQANAVRNFTGSLPDVIREEKRRAYNEGRSDTMNAHPSHWNTMTNPYEQEVTPDGSQGDDQAGLP